MIGLSEEQKEIVGAPLKPLSVVACAGSGKTRTAVYRLIEVRRQLGTHRGRVALLSFSNIAVDTFRENYQELAHNVTAFARSHIEIDTMDGFITTNVIRPHAARTMRCSRTPFLVSGTEPFLKNKIFTFWVQASSSTVFAVQPGDLHKVVVIIQNGITCFLFRHNGALLPINNGPVVAERLGEIGAYTHELGRYWCYRALTEQPAILRALSHRYPHILVDESQDVGTFHQSVLELLIRTGTQVSLIGDPNQGIYEFAGADGSFLSKYGQRPGVTQYELTRNYRSVPPILELANKLSARASIADRALPETQHGAYFVPYKPKEQQQLVATFGAEVLKAGLSLEHSAALCRGRDQADQLSGKGVIAGQGVVKGFALAAIQRDKGLDYKGAFQRVASCVAGLLDAPPQNLLAMLTQPVRYPEVSELRRVLWGFTRNSDGGLPAATLVADTEWHALLLQNLAVLLESLQTRFGLAPVNNLGRKVTKKKLPNTPLMVGAGLLANLHASIRVDTVHQAKGESLDAVLYLATKDHVEKLLAGVDTELGRIGYVAVTRARNLFWLGVPEKAIAQLRPALLEKGFLEIGTR